LDLNSDTSLVGKGPDEVNSLSHVISSTYDHCSEEVKKNYMFTEIIFHLKTFSSWSYSKLTVVSATFK